MPARPYEPNPHYEAVGGHVVAGWAEPVAGLPRDPVVLAVDGPAAMDWDRLVVDVRDALRAARSVACTIDMRAAYLPWSEVVRRTASDGLAEDPDFERLADGSISELIAEPPVVERPASGVAVVYGPGAGLVPHDVLWYVDQPKRFAEAAISAGGGRNLGQRAGDGAATTRRLFYVDWPLLDRHRDKIAPGIDRWFDLQEPAQPASLNRTVLHDSLQSLAARPFRTRPTFNTTPWGGRWAQRQLGFNAGAANTALGYELIAPESGVLVGDGAAMVEVPFQLLVALHPRAVLGAAVSSAFGTSFPVRFDYLDTVDGGNLSVHCHPRPSHMAEVFGWAYPQHETYYLMVGGADSVVFLGLREGADLDEFHRLAHRADQDGVPLEIDRFVQTFPAEAHRLFCVPAGTPHGSGAGNVVLEVSATPYLYSLRFYDWLRRDAEGGQRPVHVGHAFENLDRRRTGAAVRRDLVQEPRTLRAGNGWREEVLGALPEMFFEVRRLVLDADVDVHDATDDRFHVLNVVAGEGLELQPDDGPRHDLAYAETLVVPAAVGPYRLRRLGPEPVRVVKALVRDVVTA